jgi:DNA-binding transcriptional MerR regulator
MEATIPIREISRLTGVNSVTLRAWERRYGLIKPLRTHKGHRLYRREDVELIKTIQVWLARGLAIGKVSELLECGQPAHDLTIENIWQNNVSDLLGIMAELNLGRALIADQLIVPALDNLNQESFGNNLKKSILINRLTEYLLMLVQRQRQQANGKRIAIIQLSAAINPLLNVLLHYGFILNQVKSELIGLVANTEIVFAIEQLSLDGLIVYNDSCSSLGDFQKELTQLAQKISLPIIVGGSVASALGSGFPAHVLIVREIGQQAVVSAFNSVFSGLVIEGSEAVV